MSDDSHKNDEFFEFLAAEREPTEGRPAPPRLKARVYSALIRRQEESGPLRSLAETRARGYELCVFEDVWQRATTAEGAQCFYCCRLCHARILAERFEQPPIFWANCPYASFGGK